MEGVPFDASYEELAIWAEHYLSQSPDLGAIGEIGITLPNVRNGNGMAKFVQ